jgi:hypothetical protein
MQDQVAGHALRVELNRAVVEAGLELERLARRGILTDECRSFPGDAALEQASPGYLARRRRLRSLCQQLTLDLYRDGTALLPLLTTLRALCAAALSAAGVRHAIQQLVLAEISTACVAVSYSAEHRNGPGGRDYRSTLASPSINSWWTASEQTGRANRKP